MLAASWDEHEVQQLNNTPIYGLYNTNCIVLHSKKNFKLQDTVALKVALCNDEHVTTLMRR